MSSGDSGSSGLGLSIASSAISSISSIVGGLLAAHTARLKGATTENQAVAQVVPAFDADIAAIANAYNSGQISARDAASYFASVDTQIYRYLQTLVGRPGTSWNESTGLAGKCDNTCTSGCCVYFQNLAVVLSLAQIFLAGASIRWNGHWNLNQSQFATVSPSGVTLHVPTIVGSKYGMPQRNGYDLNLLNVPSAAANPPQSAQTGLPPLPVRSGVFSEGTPNGQTPTFSATSQNGLMTASFLQPGSSISTFGGMSSTGTLGIIVAFAAIASAVFAGIALSHRK